MTCELLPYVYFVKWNTKVIGYLTGCPSTKDFISKKSSPEYKSFMDLLDKFPAHLHINLTSHARGKGIGTLLINKFCEDLKINLITGAHVITALSSRNFSFYEKNDFINSTISKCNNYLFLGRKLDKIG